MNYVKKLLVGTFLFAIALLNISSLGEVFAQGKYEEALQNSVKRIEGKVDVVTINNNKTGGENITNFIIEKTIKVVIPLGVVMGIVFAILGFYRIIFLPDEETTKTGFKYILYGVIGILVMMSARYLTDVVSGELFSTGGTNFAFDPANVSSLLYDKIAYPFIKIAFYLVLGVLFIVVVMQVFKYLFSTDDKIKKSISTIIVWNFVGLLIIIGAKQIIEAVYGKKEQILSTGNTSLGDIGDAVLATKELPIFYTVINRVMSLTALLVLIIIIYQSYLLLTQPDSADQFKRVKKSMLYIFIGIIVIGAGYLITNFLIIN